MGRRLDLHAELKAFCENVYFQPPEKTTLKYPCIVYRRDYSATTYANNAPYNVRKRYLVTVIDRNPDSQLPDNVEYLPLCTFQRAFTTETLNHSVFELYF